MGWWELTWMAFQLMLNEQKKLPPPCFESANKETKEKWGRDWNIQRNANQSLYIIKVEKMDQLQHAISYLQMIIKFSDEEKAKQSKLNVHVV